MSTKAHYILDPLVLVTFTIAVYAGGAWLYRRLGKVIFLQPVLISILLVVLGLKFTGLSYDRYWTGTTALHFLLGPAIVALAVPLYENLRKARAVIFPVLAMVLLGGVWVTGSAVLLGVLFHLDRLMLISLTSKSVTVPIALAIAEKIGGVAPLTIVSVFTTGIAGVICTPSLLRSARMIGLRTKDRLDTASRCTDPQSITPGGIDPRVIGFTLGLTSHAFGVVRALEFGSAAVAFATLGMVLMGCASAVVIPAIFRLL